MSKNEKFEDLISKRQFDPIEDSLSMKDLHEISAKSCKIWKIHNKITEKCRNLQIFSLERCEGV